ncbi:hypothetical protein [Amycolatopsis australiensis]|uniref:Uncharacterized protein n=1 Tax=Amycolatopsis australiensis TaxID=546364 RepID=A0A1K1S1P7_9PSEU|nr:hypothetical protein [Amycolatopsis australiensis]SFW78082.1 hypothetical protein SAMN04489730_4437 [Amycolatopsis australiensis]
MGLEKVWIKTLSDGLLRADQIVGLTAHATPSLPGKSPRWLLDATVAVPAGSGTGGNGWDIGILHRTLIQTRAEPAGAPEALARLLARLDRPDTAGIITPLVADPPHATPVTSTVRFAFASFTDDTSAATTSTDAATSPDSVQEGAGVG